MNDDSGAAATQLQYFINTLLSVQYLIGLVVIGVVTVMCVTTPRVKWLALTGLIFATCLAPDTFSQTQALRGSGGGLIGMLRVAGRPLTGALLFALLPAVIAAQKAWREKSISRVAVAFFAFQILFSLRFAFDGFVQRAIVGGLLFSMCLLVISFGLGRWIQNFEDADRAVAAVAGAGLLITFFSSIQLFIGPGQVMQGNRFIGVTNNSQHVAVALGLAIPATAYLIMAQAFSKTWRRVYAVALGFECMFMIWSGSRTGALVCVVTVLLTFRRRVGKLAVVGIVGAVFVLVAMQVFSISQTGIGKIDLTRLLSTADTRSSAWRFAFDGFISNPILGNIVGDGGFAENSLLATGQRFGIIGLVPLLIAIGLGTSEIVRIRRNRAVFDAARPMLADLVTASVVGIFLGSFFEAYLLAGIGMPVYVLLLYLSIFAFLDDIRPHLLADPGFEVIVDEENLNSPNYVPEYQDPNAWHI